jgi:hypothetical protein
MGQMMPTVFRAMFCDPNHVLPMIGANKHSLGVDIGTNPDIRISDTGLVEPNSGGMSVAPHWRDLPAHRIPKRFIQMFHGARGKDEYCIWRFGTGLFQTESINEGLMLVIDKPTHGTFQPAQTMHIVQFQQLLAETRTDWVLLSEKELHNENK